MQSESVSPAVVLEGDVRIPIGLPDLEAFRRWARTEACPDKARIDYLAGDVEVEMSPDELSTHAVIKTAIVTRLAQEVDAGDRGYVLSGRARVVSAPASMSVEPDVVLVLHETLQSGRVSLVPKSGELDRFTELDGPVDLVVEVISDSSTRKDRVRMRKVYERAGVPEFWIVDARRAEPEVTVMCQVDQGYQTQVPDANGFHRSRVLHQSVKLVRQSSKGPLPRYKLELRS